MVPRLDAPSLARLLGEALPEGILRPDGRIAGFLYFERVPADVGEVVLRARLENAESGRTEATLEVGFREADRRP